MAGFLRGKKAFSVWCLLRWCGGSRPVNLHPALSRGFGCRAPAAEYQVRETQQKEDADDRRRPAAAFSIYHAPSDRIIKVCPAVRFIGHGRLLGLFVLAKNSLNSSRFR